MPNKKLFSIGGLIIIIALVAGVAGAGIYMMRRTIQVIQKPKEEVSQERVSTRAEEVSLAPEIDTSGWKTYRNEEYRFEMKYPERWTVVSESNGLDVGFKSSPEAKLAELWIETVEKPKEFDLRAYLEKKFDYSPYALSTLKPLDVNGHPAYYIEEPGLAGWDHSVYVSKDDLTLHWGAGPRVEFDVFLAIINSIVFIPRGK